MRKFLLTLGVASLAISSFAGTRVLYQQNFETVPDAAAAGWSYGSLMSIGSDSDGKYLELNQNNQNGRSAQVTWGQDIFMKDGSSILPDGVYTLEYSFSIKQGSNNQYNSEFTVFTNHAPIVNNLYRTPWSQKPEASLWDNYLFDMAQYNYENNKKGEPYQFAVDAPVITSEADGVKSYAIDFSDLTTFAQGNWYTVKLDVNVDSREVSWSVIDLSTNEPVVDGTRVVPEADINGDPISMYAEGLFILVARGVTIYDIDDIKIYFESDEDYANVPTVALSRIGRTEDDQIDEKIRAYSITFLEGETLHVVGTDGADIAVDYDECDGSYTYETTTSGALKAYTTCGTATSEAVEVVVDCDPIKLPEVVATISSVTEGFGKTYTLSVDNTDVPLRPSISIAYEFTGVSGNKFSSTEDVYSGAKVTVDEEGTLKITSMAAGFAPTTSQVVNDLEFETKLVYDFARMTVEEIKAAGLTKVDPLRSDATSGENNWTARKRLYYNDVNSATENEDGETVYTAVYPFGYVAEDENALIERYLCDNTGKESVDSEAYFDGLSIFPDAGKKKDGFPNVGMLYRIGLYNNETFNNNNNVIIKNLDATDFVVVNSINNYGGNSIHPVVATAEEYYKALAGEDAVYSVATQGTEVTEGEGEAAVGTGVYTLTHALYRIDTAITKITIFKQAGSQSGVTGVEAEVEGDNWYYSIDGVRMAEPTRPGIYIHNGKKIIVK